MASDEPVRLRSSLAPISVGGFYPWTVLTARATAVRPIGECYTASQAQLTGSDTSRGTERVHYDTGRP